VSKIFHQFDGRMNWIAGKLNVSPLKSVYCILQDKKERSKYVGIIIATLITFALSVLSFILMFDYSIFIYFFIGLILLFVLDTKIFYEIENRYNYYKYDLIINEIKKNKYRLDYSNDRTGHIRYTKKGEGHSIYVFKGKNAKSAR
jgi:hypothetical protein